MKKIHVGFLLSYDYEKLRHSIPAVYEHSDKIYLAKDIELRTWSGQKFTIENSFFTWIKEFDIYNKIEVYEDNFYIPDLTALENDTRERHLLSLKMGIGNWLIQVDSDEYFIDFKKFVDILKKYDHYLDFPEKNKIQIAAFWIIIYKYTKNGILYVDKPQKAIFATNFPNYECARRTNERVIYTNSIVMHESLSRSEEELRFKINNWGHNSEVNDSFMEKWKLINEDNYMNYSNFYYIKPQRWKKLAYLPTQDINEIKKYILTSNLKSLKVKVILKNFGQWFKFLFK